MRGYSVALSFAAGPFAGESDVSVRSITPCRPASALTVALLPGAYILDGCSVGGPSGEFRIGSDGSFDPLTTGASATVQPGAAYACTDNRAPVAVAGANVTILSSEQASTTLAGTASDPDGDELTYRWLDAAGDPVYGPAQVVDGAAPLALGALPPLALGDHAFTLEATDPGGAAGTSTLILTVENAPPVAGCSGGGAVQAGAPVTVGGQVADFDGDPVSYQWFEGDVPLGAARSLTPPAGGAASSIDPLTLSTGGAGADLGLGTHVLTLSASDGSNAPVTCEVTLEVIDTVAPALNLVSDTSILWPPNGQMVDVRVDLDASDSSGGAVTVDTPAVAILEPPATAASGEPAQDFEVVEVIQPTPGAPSGAVRLRLRADRTGSGTGRTYKVTVVAMDEAFNSSTASISVVAPHDRRRR